MEWNDSFLSSRQHDMEWNDTVMEWNDTVNVATTTRWFKFLSASELPNSLYEWETERNDNISLQKLWETPLAKFECKDDVGFDAEEPLISDFMDRSTIKECLHILPELPLETMWLDDWFDYHDCIQGFTNQQNYDETHPLDCCDDTTIRRFDSIYILLEIITLGQHVVSGSLLTI